MKRRSVIMIIMTFMLLTLVGVGFATWIIIEPTKESTAEGNIKVEKVESKVAWQFDAKWVDADGKEIGEDKEPEIVFGMPSETVKKAWLTNNEIAKENLTVYLYVKANETDVEVGEDDYAKIDLLVDLLAIITTQTVGDGQETTTVPTLSEYLKEVATVSVTVKEDKTNTPVNELSKTQLQEGVTLKITFGWMYKDGDKTVTENPYTYFNGKDYETYHVTANTYLTNLYNKLENCSFKVVLTADVK